MVVLPEPVGPVTRMMPLGLLHDAAELLAAWSASMPTLFRSSETTERSSTRMTTLSPNMVGSTETRRSTGWPPTVSSMRPSCGSAPLGDVEIGHDLDAGGDGKGQMARRRHHFVQHAVGLDADAEFVLERLEVQVAGVVLDRQQQHHVEQLADRGAVGQGLDAASGRSALRG